MSARYHALARPVCRTVHSAAALAGAGLICAISIVALMGATASASSSTNQDRTTLRRHARLLYGQAQKACADKHDLSQMRTIIREAALIKKYGGKARSQAEIYRCLRFQLTLQTRVTVDSTWNDPSSGQQATLHFTYRLTPRSLILDPTSFSPTGVVSTSSGRALGHGRVALPDPNLSVKGKATLTDCGPSGCGRGPASCAQVTANGTQGPRAYGAVVSMNPSATEPRSTLYVGFSINPPVEKYRIARWVASDCSTPSGATADQTRQVFPAFFERLHQFPHDVSSIVCGNERFTPKILGEGVQGSLGLRWRAHTSLIADGDWNIGAGVVPSTTSNGCQIPGMWFTTDTGTYRYNVTEATHVNVLHFPNGWNGPA